MINLSVITAGVLSVRRFLNDLQTGKLGLTLNDREIEMTSGSGGRLKSKAVNSQLSGVSGGSKRHQKELNGQSQIKSSTRVFDDSRDARLRPDKTTRYMTRVVGGREHARNDEEDVPAGTRTVNDDSTTDDKSTSSLKGNAVYQQQDFEMHIEYDQANDLEHRR
jgi:hypothetical protein